MIHPRNKQKQPQSCNPCKEVNWHGKNWTKRIKQPPNCKPYKEVNRHGKNWTTRTKPRPNCKPYNVAILSEKNWKTPNPNITCTTTTILTPKKSSWVLIQTSITNTDMILKLVKLSLVNMFTTTTTMAR